MKKTYQDIINTERKVADELQTLDAKILSMILKDEVNMKELIIEELKSRGLNGEGEWVGYKDEDTNWIEGYNF